MFTQTVNVTKRTLRTAFFMEFLESRSVVSCSLGTYLTRKPLQGRKGHLYIAVIHQTRQDEVGDPSEQRKLSSHHLNDTSHHRIHALPGAHHQCCFNSSSFLLLIYFLGSLCAVRLSVIQSWVQRWRIQLGRLLLEGG